MGRPSKLTERQVAEINRRLLAGEKASDLAAEFKVSKSLISRQVAKPLEEAKSVANQLVSAESSLRSLPVSQQLLALNIADDLRSISMHLAGAAKFSSATAHRLAGIAHGKVQEIDDTAPLNDESREAIKDVMVLTKASNDAANIPLNLIAANKGQIALDQSKASVPRTLADFYGDQA